MSYEQARERASLRVRKQPALCNSFCVAFLTGSCPAFLQLQIMMGKYKPNKSSPPKAAFWYSGFLLLLFWVFVFVFTIVTEKKLEYWVENEKGWNKACNYNNVPILIDYKTHATVMSKTLMWKQCAVFLVSP